jgi:hypothetical protein
LASTKFYYDFLLYKFSPYAEDDSHRLWQKSTTRERLGTLKDVLNAGIRKKYGRTSAVVRAVEPRVARMQSDPTRRRVDGRDRRPLQPLSQSG